MRQIIIAISVLPLVLAGCGYESCPQVSSDPNILNIHLVPHSHDDVGWLKTVDQYYLGANRDGWYGWEEVQRAGVQYTLDTVVTELYYNPERKYIQVETAYFWRWWNQQDQETKEIVHLLVQEGQLEFIGGGWSMNDEGAAHYAAIVDQMSLGLRILNDTFGECGRPRVAWQIDPFGHSKEQASLFANMGFDGLFFGRLDWRDKTRRENELEMEMVWKSSQDLGLSSDLFTGVLFNNYGPPDGFCWDLLCNDEPLMDNPLLENNIDERMDKFSEYVFKQAKYYKSNNIMLTMGMDFHYQAAHSWFMNLDVLIKHGNGFKVGERELNVFYSTPSCYLQSLLDSGISWPTKTDDFFPYASDPHAYWSGYFSSRPTSKGMIRDAERALKILTQLSFLTKQSREKTLTLEKLKQTVGVIQHHDAVTGTEKQHVTDDYHRRIHLGLEESFSTFSLEQNINICNMLNISQCLVSENLEDNLAISVYNPLSRGRTVNIRIPIAEDGTYTLQDENAELIPIQILPIPEHVFSIPGRNSSAKFELVATVENIPPLGFTNLILTKTARNPSKPVKKRKTTSFKLSNNKVQLVYKHKKNRFCLTDKMTGEESKFDLDIMYYVGHRGNNSEFEFRASGAYIFRPDGDNPISFGPPVSVEEYPGELVDELHFKYEAEWVNIIIRTYKTEPLIEIDWTVGPIPVSDGIGKEVIIRYSTDIQNNGEFFTDSNGRQLLGRIRNYRPTFEINMTEPTAQNYYPVNSKILIRDEAGSELGVLVDRSQGGGSIQDGSVELMVHRRLLDDDAFGVGEPLNETEFGVGLVARGKHWVLRSSEPEVATAEHRLRAMEMFYQPLLIFNSQISPEISLNTSVPENLHILSLERIFPGFDPEGEYLLLRVEHIFQVDEHPIYSQSTTLNIRSLFSGLVIDWVEETGLAGNIWKDDISRFSFQHENNDIPVYLENTGKEKDGLEFVINPMEIRTFIVKYSF